jgi:hypothetical protein
MVLVRPYLRIFIVLKVLVTPDIRVFIVPDPGKGVCTDPVNGGAILGRGGGEAPRREQGVSVEPR